MSYGITPTGFRRKRLADIKSEIEQKLRVVFGQNINLLSQSVFSQFVGVFADREALIWEMAEQSYYTNSPERAEGSALNDIASISGITRLGAKSSRVKNVHLFGDAGSTIPSGTILSVLGSPNSRFQTLSGVTLVAGQDEIQKISFSAIPTSGTFKVGYRDQETGAFTPAAIAQDIQDELNSMNFLSEVEVTGDFALGFTVSFLGADGKIDHELLEIIENPLAIAGPIDVTAEVEEIQEGIPQGLVEVEALSTGPIIAPEYTLTEIETPVTGLDSAVNTEKEVIGRNVETDGEFRLRRIQSLQRAGSSTVEAIRARLLEVQDVGEVVVFENVTKVIDIHGLNPSSFKAFVQGGNEQEIADSIWNNKPAGIETMGDITKLVTDSQGVVQTIKFSRPTEIEVYIKIKVTKDVSPLSKWPANGADLVREYLAEYVNSLTIGSDVIVYPRMISSLNSIPGLLDIEIGVGIAPPAYGDDDNIEVEINEIALITDPATQIEVVVIP